MSERANPAVVGGFVVGALVLLVAGVLLFGSGAFLRERVPVVAFFSGNVRGLQEGSAVEFRGVRVGSVTGIQLALDADSKDLLIPVFMELDARSLTVLGTSREEVGRTATAFLDELVARGLRARLDLKSFVTGQLAVGLDMYPESSVERLGAVAGVYELPTVSSTLDRVAELLQELPLQDIAVKLIDTLDNVARLLADDALGSALHDIAATAAETRVLTAELRAAARPTLEDLRATLGDTRAAVNAVAQQADATLDSSDQLADDAARRLDGFATRLDTALDELDGLQATLDARVGPVADAAVAAFDEARGALAGAGDVLAADSPTRYNIDRTLEELAAAARSLRIMAEFLEQHPDALLRGKNL